MNSPCKDSDMPTAAQLAIQQYAAVARALRALRSRTGRDDFAVSVKAGTFRLESVVPTPRGTSRITPITSYLPGADLVAHIERI
jgi:hypothetical protein